MILAEWYLLKLPKRVQFSFKIGDGYNHSIALWTLYNFAFELKMICPSVQPQIDENKAARAPPCGNFELYRNFAAKLLIGSSWIQKPKNRALKELSNGI